MAKGSRYDQQFKENAVRYRLEHPELSLQKAAENLGISDSALKTWLRAARENEGSSLAGNAPSRHNNTRQHKHRYCKQRKTVKSSQHGPDHIGRTCRK